MRKRDGSTFTYQYDPLNRMTAKIVPERTGLAPTHTRDVHYGYDVRNLPSYVRFDSPSGEGVANAYDAFGRLTATTLNMDGVARTIQHRYDSGSRRERVIHPDWGGFSYAYNAAGALTGLYDGAGTANPLAIFSYDAPGRLRGRVEWNSSIAYDYDPLHRLASISDSFAGGTGNVTLGFGYNPASQIVSRSRNNDAYASNTVYEVNRSYSVNGLNQYTAAGTATFQYDANGNLTSDGTTTFTYDVENRLVAAGGARSAALRYDRWDACFRSPAEPRARLASSTATSSAPAFSRDHREK